MAMLLCGCVARSGDGFLVSCGRASLSQVAYREPMSGDPTSGGGEYQDRGSQPCCPSDVACLFFIAVSSNPRLNLLRRDLMISRYGKKSCSWRTLGGNFV